jgi:hypothetical protein
MAKAALLRIFKDNPQSEFTVAELYDLFVGKN